MNIARWKFLAWVCVLGVAGWLGWQVTEFLFLGGKDRILERVPDEEILEVLRAEGPQIEEARARIPKSRIDAALVALNWSGRKPVAPPPPPKPEDERPAEKPKIPVSELLQVAMIRYCSFDSEQRLASVNYRHPDPAMQAEPESTLLIGDHLPGQFSYVYVSAIEPEWVEFAFEDDEEREPERLVPPEVKSDYGIVYVADGEEALAPEQQSAIFKVDDPPPFRPKQTYQLGESRYLVGTDDARYVAENYTSILAREVRTARHRDPRTGKYTGLRVTKVVPGSIAERHGIQTGRRSAT